MKQDQIDIINAQAKAQESAMAAQAAQELVRARQQCLSLAMEAIRENRGMKMQNEAEDITSASIVEFASALMEFIGGDSEDAG